MGAAALASPELAGVHFTGSTAVFHSIWRTIGNDIDRYRGYPRIVGETGGKNFVLAHPVRRPGRGCRRDRARLVRVPGPEVLGLVPPLHPVEPLGDVRETLEREVGTIGVGDVSDFTNFMGAVIDEPSFKHPARRDRRGARRRRRDRRRRRHGRQRGLVRRADRDQDGRPRLPAAARRAVRADRHRVRLRRVEVGRRRSTSSTRRAQYALTGAVFSNDRYAIAEAHDALRYAAGNFYVNDKPTGRSSVSSRSVAPAPPARTTRPARCGT